MPKTREIPIEKRALIIAKHQIGISNRKIATELKIGSTTVDYIVKKYASSGNLSNKTRSGRPRVTTPADDRFIVSISKRNRRLTASQITAEFNVNSPNPVSVTTVKRRLLKAGLRGCVAVKKPFLRPVNKKKRLEWAKFHKDWTTDQWKSVLWSDESKFEVFGSKRRTFVRRFPGERCSENLMVASVKHGGGSVMVWGCFGGNEVGDLVKIDGILNKDGYKKILQKHVLTSGNRIIGRGFIFQQDNDPKHTSKLCQNYLNQLERQGKLKVMVWPAQSPDLNPIELLWDQLDRQVRQQNPTSINHLWSLLQTEWAKITAETLENLLRRMPKLCNAVIKSRGGHIDEAAI